nr:YfjI family protein [Saccharopolyspora rosea]
MDPETQRRALTEIERARAELPPRDEAMFGTYLGSVVRQLEPTSEADPANILASLMAATGVYLGDGPYLRAGDDRHPLLVWPMVIGRTGIGRKGAGWSAAKRLLLATDPDFVERNIHSGLTSGEGLTQAFTADEDEATGPDDGEEKSKGKRRASLLPPGDRRLLAFETEWATVMARMKREGNTLSATLRAAWEGGNLSTLGVTARIVRDTHIAILAHITPREFQAKLSASDMAGGTYNRFLPVLVAQTQYLPGGTGADPKLLDRLAVDLRARLDTGAQLGQLRMTREAAALWQRLYVEFGGYSTDDGPIEQFLSRAAPNCLRVAGLHAALDGTPLVEPHHLAAAAAFVRYAVASARAVFTTSNPKRDKLARFIADAGPAGRTRTEISQQHFRGNEAAANITALLDQLAAEDVITKTFRRPEGRKGGRATETYVANEHHEITKFASDQGKR